MTPNIIPSIFTAVDQLSAPVRRMGLSLQGLGVYGAAAGARMERAFLRTGTAAMQMATSATMVGAAIIIPLALATKAAIDFEKEMGDVATLVDITKESMSQMGDNVQRLGKKIPKTLEDLSKALYQIRSDGIAAGNGINEAMGVLETSGKLATAGLSTTEEAAESVTSAMNVFADEGLTSIQVANSFFKTVQGGKTKMSELNVAFGRNAAIIREANVSLEEFNAMTATMTMTGMKAATAQMGIGQAVTALIKPSTELTQVYESLGYTGSDAFRRIVTDSGGLVAAMEKIDAQGNKLGISFGEDFREKRAMTTELLLTGRLHEQYKKNYAIQMNGQDALEEAFGKQSKTAAAQMQLFKTRTRELGISVGNLLIPALNKLMTKLSPIIDGITDFAREHKLLSGTIVTSIGYFGLAAAAIGAVSFVVGTATKAFTLINGAGKLYNAWILNAEILTMHLNTQLGLTSAASGTAAMGIKGVTAAVNGLLQSMALLTPFMINYAEGSLHDNYKKKTVNFSNNVDFSKSYEEQKPLMQQNHITESEYQTYKIQDSADRKAHPEWYQGSKGGKPTLQLQDEYDKKGIEALKDPKNEATNKDIPSVSYVPKSSKQEFTFKFLNAPEGLAYDGPTSVNSAPRVKIEIVSTSSRNTRDA